MAKLESSGIHLTSNFYLRNFYKDNQKAFKASTRKEYSKTELSYEDSRALKRAANRLLALEDPEDENMDNLISHAKAFVETFNNTLSSSDSKHSSNYRYHKQLKNLSQKYKEEFSDIGIRMEKDGSLKLSENILKASSHEDLSQLFSKKSQFMKETRTIARRIHATSYDEIYAQLTGSGNRLNISL